MPTYAATKAGYANLWAKAKVTAARRSEADAVARRIITNRHHYEAVEQKTGVPWFWIGAVHDREAAGSFAGVLHNGEKIIGKGVKTKLVPAGRGPFTTWEEAAVDALEIKGLQRVDDWPISRMLYEAERFNGWGYTNKGVNSPYVWGATNLQQPGKYVADHVWSPTAMDQQLGVAAVLRALMDQDADIAEHINGAAPPVVVPGPPPAEPVRIPDKLPEPAPCPPITGEIIPPSEIDRIMAEIAAVIRPIVERRMSENDQLAKTLAAMNDTLAKLAAAQAVPQPTPIALPPAATAPKIDLGGLLGKVPWGSLSVLAGGGAVAAGAQGAINWDTVLSIGAIAASVLGVRFAAPLAAVGKGLQLALPILKLIVQNADTLQAAIDKRATTETTPPADQAKGSIG